MIRNLLFDLDGTLSDPALGITRCIRFALGEIGLTPPPAEELTVCIGPPLHVSLAELLGHPPAEQVERALALYRQRFVAEGMFENRVYDGIPELLGKLAAECKRLFVATSKPIDYARPILEHFALDGFFSGIYGAELDGPRSAKGELLAYLVDSEGLAVAECVMIGDRRMDIEGARANRMAVIAVAWGYGTADELRDARPDAICPAPAALPAIIRPLARFAPLSSSVRIGPANPGESMNQTKVVTACVLIIGNEVLSGRTADANLHWLAGRLGKIGVRLAEARIIPDVEETIAAAVNETRAAFDYVITTGGIGPTHDDITTEAVALAFGVEVERNPKAVAILEDAMPKDRLNAARMRMAEMPVGATLVQNPVSRAPGFRMDNVYVLAGVPSIMRAMFDAMRHELIGGAPVLSRTVSCLLPEGDIAAGLGDIQKAHAEVDIGSYPYFRMGKYGVSLVARCTDEEELAGVIEEVREMIRDHGAEPLDEELL